MSSTGFSRRKLLAAVAAAGGVARLGPFVPAAVRAAEAPKRILTVFHPMGYLENSFFPAGEETNFTLGECMTALDPWKSKLVFMDNLAVYGPQYFFKFADNEHGLGSAMAFTGGKYIYTGDANPSGSDTASIDQAIAEFQYSQVRTPFRSLNLGVNTPGGANSHTAVFYSKPTTPIVAQRSSQAAFDQLFKNFSGPSSPPPPTGGGQPTQPTTPMPDAVLRRTKQQESVLNFVRKDLGRVRALAGAEDQQRLDSHLDGISSLELRLKIQRGQSASTVTVPSPSSGGSPVAAGSVTVGCAQPTMTMGSIETAVHMQMDLIVAAFACDMTRSASLQLAACDGGMDDAVPGHNQHDITHNSSANAPASVLENHKKFDRWYAARWAYLLNRLDSIKEGNGTMLDNTLIMFSSDTTTGQRPKEISGSDPGAHWHTRMTTWLAGGGNFAFKTGRYLKLPGSGKFLHSASALNSNFVVQHRLLTSICQAFGMNVDSYGGNDPGKGSIAKLLRA